MSRSYALKINGRMLTPELPLSSWIWSFLLLSFFILLGLPRSFTAVIVVLVFVGIYQFARLVGTRGFSRLPPAYKWYLLIFLLYWIPLLLSLTDADYPDLAVPHTFLQLPYLFVGFATVWLAKEKNVIAPLTVLMTGLAIFLTGDVIFQRAFGFDIFGVPYITHSAGAYYQSAGKLGIYLACFNLLALHVFAPKVSGPGRFMLLWLFFCAGVVLTMSRTAWLIFFLFSIPLLWRHFFQRLPYRWIWMAAGLLALCVVTYLSYKYDPIAHARIDRTLALKEGMTYEAWNNALTYRVDLWRASVHMISEHWLNGMGLDAFVHHFRDYPADPWWQNFTPSHEHQYILQVLDATGLIGLVGIIGIHLIVFRLWKGAGHERYVVTPFLIYIFSMWFPLNSHYSFYSSEYVWGNLLVIGLIVGGACRLEKPEVEEA